MSVNAQYPDSHDSLACKRTFLPDTELEYFSVRNIMRSYPDVQYWPAVKLVLLENLLRHEDGSTVTADLIHDFLQGRPSGGPEIPFFPARLLMQDYAGISALVDFAGLRDEVQTSGGKAVALIPALPVDLVVDHSLQVAPIIAARDVLSRLKASVRPESIISVDVLDSCTIRPQVSVLVLTNGVEAVFECVLQTETSNEYKLAAAGGLLGIFDQGRRQKH